MASNLAPLRSVSSMSGYVNLTCLTSFRSVLCLPYRNGVIEMIKHEVPEVTSRAVPTPKTFTWAAASPSERDFVAGIVTDYLTGFRSK
jgi:hypothetical protein